MTEGGPSPVEGTKGERFAVLSGGPEVTEREERLAATGAALETSGRGAAARQHVLLIISATLMAGGLAAILLGWLGASRTIRIEAQVPYLISGGLLGVALATIGAITFFAHWLTVLIAEVRGVREDHRELMQLLRQRDEESPPKPRRARASGTRSGGAPRG